MPSSLEVTHRIRIHADGHDNDALEDLAEATLTALADEASGCALGVIASIETDQQVVELVFQTLAPSPSARARKMATIYEALENLVDINIVDRDQDQVRDVVAA